MTATSQPIAMIRQQRATCSTRPATPPTHDGMRDLRFEYKTTPEGARMGEIFQAMLSELVSN